MPWRITFSPVGNSVSFAPYCEAALQNSAVMDAPLHSSTVTAICFSLVFALRKMGSAASSSGCGRTAA